MAIDWMHEALTEWGLTILLGVDLFIAAVIYFLGVTRDLNKWWLRVMILILTFVEVRTWYDEWSSNLATLIALGAALFVTFLMWYAEIFLSIALLGFLAHIISLVIVDDKIQRIVLFVVVGLGLLIYFAKYQTAQTVLHHLAVTVVTSYVGVLTGFFFAEKANAQTFRHSVNHLRARINCLAAAVCNIELFCVIGFVAFRLVVLLWWHQRKRREDQLEQAINAARSNGMVNPETIRLIIRDELSTRYAQPVPAGTPIRSQLLGAQAQLAAERVANELELGHLLAKPEPSTQTRLSSEEAKHAESSVSRDRTPSTSVVVAPTAG